LLRRQEQVLGQLLRDGGTAAHDASTLLVAFPGIEHRIEFVAGMIDEVGILAGDHGALDVARDIVVAHPLPLTGQLQKLKPHSRQRSARMNVVDDGLMTCQAAICRKK
jgi:hypothetical protein